MDIAYLQSWTGRTQSAADVLTVSQARLMAATLGLPQEPLCAGAELPPLWHWIYFLEGRPPAELGRDGHPARGGFLPPVPLPNRMWAGGDVTFEAPLRLDAAAQRESRILNVEGKSGRSGPLVFVTVEHRIVQNGQLAVRELHHIVYKEAAAAGAAGAEPPAMPVPAHSTEIEPDSTQLFRYSALTFNGHRIHYDLDYCRQVEGYDNLVIHGPLIATQLAGWAGSVAGKPLRRFVYRGLQPALLGQRLALHAAADAGADGTREVWLTLASGRPSMRALAHF